MRSTSNHAKQKAIAAITEAAPAVMAVPVKRVDEVKLPPPSPSPLLELSAFHEISTGPMVQLALEVEVGFQMAPNSTLAPLLAI